MSKPVKIKKVWTRYIDRIRAGQRILVMSSGAMCWSCSIEQCCSGAAGARQAETPRRRPVRGFLTWSDNWAGGMISLRQILARRRLAEHVKANLKRIQSDPYKRDSRGRFFPGVPGR